MAQHDVNHVVMKAAFMVQHSEDTTGAAAAAATAVQHQPFRGSFRWVSNHNGLRQWPKLAEGRMEVLRGRMVIKAPGMLVAWCKPHGTPAERSIGRMIR